jgi:hypothetical protein
MSTTGTHRHRHRRYDDPAADRKILAVDTQTECLWVDSLSSRKTLRRPQQQMVKFMNGFLWKRFHYLPSNGLSFAQRQLICEEG